MTLAGGRLARLVLLDRYRNFNPVVKSHQPEVSIMKWDTPSYSDIRFGFEVTMYINNK